LQPSLLFIKYYTIYNRETQGITTDTYNKSQRWEYKNVKKTTHANQFKSKR